MNLFELFVKIGVDDQASGKLKDLGGKLGNGLKTAAKIGTAAVGAAATGIAALTTAAVNNYAEYEQLVGGVETLFKTSSDKVQQYAANAYKTAGMSANEYMSTVTSFSASLIGSLATSTEQATGAITEETIDALNNQLEAMKESQEEQVEALEKANDKKISLLEKANEKEISDFEKLTEEKIALIDKQYQENLKLVDEEEYNRIKAIEAQINALNAQTEAEEKAAEQEEQARKKAELEKKVANAKSVEERKNAEQDLSDYLLEIARKELQEERKQQIESLKNQKAAVKEEADAKREALKQSRDEQVKEVKETSSAQLEALKEGQKEQLAALKESQKEELDALKKSNKQKIDETKAFIKEQKKLVTDGTVQVKTYSDEVYAQAAEYADMAITDMSDNANKMGTSMEMIQNAYQGFAKQNYTMLDNLKLGYGGTKEEMQRLLEDAEKISGIEYEISSYADIVDAIHVVQTEMGITGTTAKEAGTTIQGSVASMKSAWTNLLTGLADGNADIEQLVDNLVTTVVGDGTETNLGVLGNILPAVETALSGAATLVGEALPEIVGIIPTIINDNLPVLAEAAIGIIQSLIDGISENQGMLFDTILGVVTYLAESFVEMLPQIVELGLDLIVSLADGISESLPELIPTIVDVVLQIVETLIDNVDMLIDASLEIILALADGLIESLPKLIEEIPGLVIKIVDAIIENAPKFLESAAEIIANLISGLIEGLGEIAIKVGGWIYDNIAQPIIDKVSDFKDAGKELLEGLWNGISDKVAWLREKVSGVVDTIKGWFTGKDGFDEHSPSKWSKQVFRYVMEGSGEGLEDGLPNLMNDVRLVTNKVKGGLDFGTAPVDFASSGVGQYTGALQSAFGDLVASMNQEATIIVQSVLDGKVIGETAYQYSRNKAKAYGV